MEIRRLARVKEQVRTGPIQFGTNDWPGVFIRGDEALALADLLERTTLRPENFIKLLRSCRIVTGRDAGLS
jgi:hypothetical protein